jgi:glycogen phosphorylase
VESEGVDDVSPEVGARLEVRAYVALGEVSTDDVDVQVVHGRVDEDDQLLAPSVTSLTVAETYESGRHRYEGSVELDRTGPFGYTVRVLPRNPLLSSGAELGLVALPQLPDPDLSATLR